MNIGHNKVTDFKLTENQFLEEVKKHEKRNKGSINYIFRFKIKLT